VACLPVLPVTLWPKEGESTGISPGHAPPVEEHVLAIPHKTGLLTVTLALPTTTTDIMATVTVHSLPVELPTPQIIMVQAVLWVINTLHNPSTNSGVYPVPSKLLPTEIGELSTHAVVNHDIYACCSTSYCHALLPYVSHDWPYSFIYRSHLYGSSLPYGGHSGSSHPLYVYGSSSFITRVPYLVAPCRPLWPGPSLTSSGQRGHQGGGLCKNCTFCYVRI